MEIKLNNELNDWGYFVDLENLKTNLPKNEEIINKKNISKPTKFQYSDYCYKEYCDEYKFNINHNVKKNINKLNIVNNKNKMYIFCISSSILSISLVLLLLYKKKCHFFLFSYNKFLE